ncbi:MAG: aminotransferase class III-fold pyridoxal phosphate-dependent enzyme [Acidimicrobiia bacterium]|nr:aminotransferase class III-fold pyridoxal phosphate-dependent enzyme [Acidimicrobiia bacterium]
MAMHATDLTPVETQPVNTRFRRIVTAIPVPESLDEIRRLRSVEPLSMAGMPPIVWDRAEGFQVSDSYGNQWIDLSSGIVVANTGHAHPAILEAVRKQLDSRMIFSYAYTTRIRRQLLERLARLAPEGLGKAILFSAGTEATECAMSLMRKHGLNLAPGKLGILSIESSYHGRTLAARLAGGAPGPVDGMARERVLHWQLPLPGGPDSKGFEQDVADRGIDPAKIAGIIFESIPGWTTTLYPAAYMNELMRWAGRHQVLVTADEIQAGMGRTGRMFAFEHYGITPDLITCGKGLSSSLPLSAVIGRPAVMDLASPGEMSSTFGGNPVCVAAALASLDVIEGERLVERSASLGRELDGALGVLAERHRRHVRMRNGAGLFYSVHLQNPDTGEAVGELCDEIVMSCVRRGVLMFLTGRGFFKIVPPLTIDREALFEAVDVIGTVLAQVLESR